MKAYLDGAYLPLSEARVSAQDRGFLLGDGVYEVIRVYSGRPFRLDRHLARLDRSLDGVRIPRVGDLSGVCRTLIGDLPEATVYLQVTRGAAARTHGFPGDAKPTVFAYAQEASGVGGKVFSLRSVRDVRWGRCDLKTICLLPNVLAKQEAIDAGADEALFVSETGTVREGASTNVFLARGGVLRTHPADTRILGGVTREAVIEAARAAGVEVVEEACTLDEALSADEVFLTGTTTEVTPAGSIDGRAIGSGGRGALTARVAAAFRGLVAGECGG